jgi:putative Ca2+/H+ antiporter (TMEM165/GDT1 family)
MGMIFIAETGDKTQLVALCLASRYNAKIVLSAIFAATLIVHVISVLLGGGVSKFVPASYLSLAAGVAFIIFALWTLRGDSLNQEECDNIQGKSPFWLVFTTFFIAELGDKTMLSTVTLAAKYPLIPVWLGSTIGMVLADGIAIVIGLMLGKKLPERAVKIGAAFIFLGFGIFNGYEGAVKAPISAITVASLITLASIIGFLFLIRHDKQKLATAIAD